VRVTASLPAALSPPALANPNKTATRNIMALNQKALARWTSGAASDTGSSNITHLFGYRTTDARATVEAANYFLGAYRRLVKGSVILAVMAVGGTPVIESYVVTASSSSSVVVARESATGLTDNTTGTTGSALALAAVKQKLTIPIAGLASVANAHVYKVKVPFAHVLESALFRVRNPATTAAKLATLTATVGGVAVTGGVIALTSANCTPAGAAVDATAISGAGATGAADGTIEFTASSVTAFVEGDGYLEITVINKDLANALASLNAA
jgi:hypothetical protein